MRWKKLPVIAGRLETPAREIDREKFRGRVETARRRIATFHFVGGDERQIVFDLIWRRSYRRRVELLRMPQPFSIYLRRVERKLREMW